MLKRVIPALSHRQSKLFSPLLMDPFQSLTRATDAFFSDLEPFAYSRPIVKFKETDTHYLLTTELPGFTKDQIELRYPDEHTLEISAKSKSEAHEEGSEESEERFFSKTLSFPDAFEAEKIEAKWKDCILKISVPKTASALKEAQKIAIKDE